MIIRIRIFDTIISIVNTTISVVMIVIIIMTMFTREFWFLNSAHYVTKRFVFVKGLFRASSMEHSGCEAEEFRI